MGEVELRMFFQLQGAGTRLRVSNFGANVVLTVLRSHLKILKIKSCRKKNSHGPTMLNEFSTKAHGHSELGTEGSKFQWETSKTSVSLVDSPAHSQPMDRTASLAAKKCSDTCALCVWSRRHLLLYYRRIWKVRGEAMDVSPGCTPQISRQTLGDSYIIYEYLWYKDCIVILTIQWS